MEYTPELIDEMLSDNYDGGLNDNIEVYEDYDGSEDPDVKLFDGTTLKTMQKSTKRFAFHIINSGSADKTVVLTPGYFSTQRASAVYDDAGVLKYKLPDGTAVNAPAGLAAGDIVLDYKSATDIINAGISADVIADDGQISADITISSAYKERSVRNFQNYIAKNPTLFAAIQISSNNVQMYEQALVLRRTTPYAVAGEEVIPFQDAFTSKNLNEKKIILLKKRK